MPSGLPVRAPLRRLLPGAALVCLSVGAHGAPQSASGGPPATPQGPFRVMSLDAVRSVPRYRLDAIADYEWAVAAALSIMERELGFPRLHADVCLFRRKEALHSALVAEGHASSTADFAVATMGGISSAGIIRINVREMYALSWPARIWVLAHELTHVAQYQLAGGCRSTSEQWLREGMAEWVGMRVLETMGRGTIEDGVEKAVENLRRIPRSRPLPSLGALVSFASWQEEAGRWPDRPLYDLALVAAADLIERHGLRSLIHYFGRFASSSDRLSNFWLSFSEDPAAFETRLRASLRP